MMDSTGSGSGSGLGSGLGFGSGPGVGFTIGVTGFSSGLHEKLTENSNTELKNRASRFILDKYKNVFLILH